MTDARPPLDQSNLTASQRPNAIVHLGLNKTGSTAIQKWLALNAAQLATQGFHYDNFVNRSEIPVQQLTALGILTYTPQGILIPSKRLRRRLGITDIASQEQVFKRVEATFQKSVTEAQGKTVILSSEHLGGWLPPADRIDGIKRVFEKYFDKITYVLYVREQSDWLLSAYIQACKSGNLLSMEELADKIGEFDYLHLADMWSRQIGSEKLVVRLYDRGFMKNGDAIADFADVCGIDTSSLTSTERANEALSQRQVDAFIAMSQLQRKLGFNPGRHRRMKRRIANLFRGGAPVRMPEELMQTLRSKNASTNEAFRTKYFPDRPVLFSSSKNAAPQPITADAAPAATAQTH